ncbi:ABC transporter ATP-binding protein [Polycladidibacter stylochi]|uniref:ABC transporter ATP-binding protein n=1 Tax=Polycladidibacter stylochi TaxID=1807766 RepID=UPI0009EAB690|nr:ABC transporter ATP-binding protein [Pseudovibrio stylochi]
MTIRLANIRAGYENFALQNINLHIETGSFTCLIGPNGCGKSTLLKTIGRILKAQSGQIEVAGLDILASSSKEVARKIAFLPQNPAVPAAITVEQLVGYGRAPYQGLFGFASQEDREKVAEAITQTGLEALKDRRLSELSGGQRQRAFIAMALAQDTPYIMLDEPTSFLDLKYQYETLELLAKLHAKGRTCIVVLHDIAQAARYASDLVVMKEGQIFAKGKPEEVISPQMLTAVYGIRACVYADPVSNSPVVSPLPQLAVDGTRSNTSAPKAGLLAAE